MRKLYKPKKNNKVMDVKKVLVSLDGEKVYIKDISQNYHCNDGFIKKEDLAKNGEKIYTSKNVEYTVFNAIFIDQFFKIKRNAAIMILKEIGVIIAYTGIDKNSIVLDAGAGSGALSCFLAHIVKKVITYDIKEDHIKTVQENIRDLGIKNITIKNQDITQKVSEKNVDLVTLDLPNPSDAITNANKALKVGGFIVSYSPNLTQIIKLKEKLKEFPGLIQEKTIEIMEREWEVDERRCRPKFGDIGHTGFLVFIRKIRD